MSTVYLHNYLRTLDEVKEQQARQYCPAGYADSENAEGNVVPGRWKQNITSNDALRDAASLSSNVYSGEARKIWDTFVDYFCSVGEKEEQYDIVRRGCRPEK